MKKILPFTIVAILCAYTIHAQTLDWVKGWGGTYSEGAGKMVVDADRGAIYTTGWFNGTIDLDPGAGPGDTLITGHTTADDGFLSKFDRAGNLVWAATFGAAGTDRAVAATVNSANGDVFTLGQFTTTVDFDPGPGVFNLSLPNSVIGNYVVRLDANGNFLNAHSWGVNTGSFQGRDIAVDSAGNMYIVGLFSGTVDADPSPTSTLTLLAGSQTNPNIFLLKLDPNGNLQWAYGFGTSSDDEGNAIAIDATANIYMTGYFNGTADFDPGSGVTELNSSYRDIFVAKFDSAGNLGWARKMGGSDADYAYDIHVDQWRNVYTTGRYGYDADFDPSDTNVVELEGINNAFVSKLNADGNFIWAKRFRSTTVSTSFAIGNGIIVDRIGAVYVSGAFNYTTDFDPSDTVDFNLVSDSNYDIFLARLDSMGNFLWAGKMGGLGDQQGETVGLDTSGNVYMNGHFAGTCDFEPDTALSDTLRSNGNRDGFLLGAGLCDVTHATISPVVCDSYLSPSGHYTWTTSGTYTDYVPNAAYCDSVITIQLTVVVVDLSVTNASPTLTSNAAGAAYQWIYCDSVAIQGATNSSFMPTQNGNYAVLVTQNGCTDTSACYTVTGVEVPVSAQQSQLAISPNPSKGIFHVRWSGQANLHRDITIEVTDALGKWIGTYHLSPTEPATIDLQSQAAGCYYLRSLSPTNSFHAILINQP